MLTREEECVRALNNLKGVLATRNYDKELTKDYIEVLGRLIKDHFYNPPLKFEELKEGEWYWDNKKKRYFKIFGLDVPNKEIIAFNYWGLGFEEGRFYRKQVEEWHYF